MNLLSTDQQKMNESKPSLVNESLHDNEQRIKTLLSKMVGIDESTFSVNDTFFDIGLTSFLAVQFVRTLAENNLGVIKVTDIFQYPDIRKLNEFISNRKAHLVQGADTGNSSRNRRREALARKRSVNRSSFN